jgi:hypothetical protein
MTRAVKKRVLILAMPVFCGFFVPVVNLKERAMNKGV